MNGLHAYGLLPDLFQIRNDLLGRDQEVHLGDAIVLAGHTSHLDLAVVVLRYIRDGLNPLEQRRNLICHAVNLALQLRKTLFDRVEAPGQRLHLGVDPAVDALDLLGNLAVDDAVVCLDGRCNGRLIGFGQFAFGRLDRLVDRRDFTRQLLVRGRVTRGDCLLQQLQFGIHGCNVVVVGQLLVDPALHLGDTSVDGGGDGRRIGCGDLLAGRCNGLCVAVGDLGDLVLKLLLHSGHGRGDVGCNLFVHARLEIGDAAVDCLDGGFDGGDIADQPVVLFERGEGGRDPILLGIELLVQRGDLLFEALVGSLQRLDLSVQGVDLALHLLLVAGQLGQNVRNIRLNILLQVVDLRIGLREGLRQGVDLVLQGNDVVLELRIGLLELGQGLADRLDLLVDAGQRRVFQLVDPIGQTVDPVVDLVAPQEQQATEQQG